MCTSQFLSEFHHLQSVCPKQLCALAHLGCICKAGTSYVVTAETNVSIFEINETDIIWTLVFKVMTKESNF